MAAEVVLVDENGLPNSRNATRAGHRKGNLVRNLIPVSFKSWRDVKDNYKEDVWNELRRSFIIPETAKETCIRGMAGIWRRFKWELRLDYYDPYNTHEERIAHIPPTVKEEDWIKFCENEKEEAQQKSRAEHKKKRKRYDYACTTGRKPLSLVRAELESENPGVEITPSDVWIKAHTQEGGKILPSAQSYYDDLKKAQEDINEKLGAGEPVDEIDALVKAFGKDCRGRVRAVGPISRTAYDYSAPARAKVAELKCKDGDVKNEVKEVNNKIEMLLTHFGSLCKVVQDIQTGQASFIGSNHFDLANCSALSPATSAGQNSSPAQALPHEAETSLARSATGAREGAKCSLLNMDEEIVAVGRLCTGESALIAHGTPVAGNHAKVLLDIITIPTAPTIKVNGFARTFQEVGIGGYVVHPKAFIRFD